MVCHLFMATYQVSSLRRQLRSMTSFVLSLSNEASTACNLSRENWPLGKRNDVMMTYCLILCTQQPQTPKNESQNEKGSRIGRREGFVKAQRKYESQQNTRRVTDPFSTRLNPFLRIGVCDSTPYLEMARPGRQSRSGGLLVARAEHDDMGAEEVRITIQLRKVFGRMLRDIIRLEIGFFRAQRASDDLLDLARVQVNAWPEAGHDGAGELLTAALRIMRHGRSGPYLVSDSLQI